MIKCFGNAVPLKFYFFLNQNVYTEDFHIMLIYVKIGFAVFFFFFFFFFLIF